MIDPFLSENRRKSLPCHAKETRDTAIFPKELALSR
jgi:hypothetical protein